MKFQYSLCTLLLVSAFNVNAFLWGGETWDDLKVTWGVNPLGKGVYESMPRTVVAAVEAGWKLYRDCSKVFVLINIKYNFW